MRTKEIIQVQNAFGEERTVAEVLVRNKLDNAPKVSVVMPVYNVEAYLRESLDSVLGQSLREIELICVDDGSTDGSVDILLEYAESDSRMTIIKQKNLYAGVARNAGLSVAKGEYIIFLDSDDFFEQDMLKKTYQLAKQEDSDLVFFEHSDYIDETGEIRAAKGIRFPKPDNHKSYYTCSPDVFEDGLFTYFLETPWNKLVRLSFLRDESINFQGIIMQNDVYFAECVLALSKRITLLYEPLLYYRRCNSGRLTNMRGKDPSYFWPAMRLVARTLRSKGKFDKLSNPYLRALIGMASNRWINFREKRKEILQLMQNEVFPFVEEELRREEKNLPGFTQRWIKRFRLCPIIVWVDVRKTEQVEGLPLVVEALLQQSWLADSIVLDISSNLALSAELLPANLRENVNVVCSDNEQNIRSYYRDCIIIKIDAGVIVPIHFVRDLFDCYCRVRDESCIYATNVVRLSSHPNDKLINSGILVPQASEYNMWQYGAGKLYPPSIWCNVSNYYEYDDTACYAMAVKKGYRIMPVKVLGTPRFVNGTADAYDALNKTQVAILEKMINNDTELKVLYRTRDSDNEVSIKQFVVGEMLGRLCRFRIEINHSLPTAEFEIIGADVFLTSSPEWLCRKGYGILLQGAVGIHEFKVNVKRTGKLSVRFRGENYVANGRKLPLWVDVKAIQIDGVDYGSHVVWHEKAYGVDIDVNAGQQIVIRSRTAPHIHLDEEMVELLEKLYPDSSWVRSHCYELCASIQEQVFVKKGVTLASLYAAVNMPYAPQIQSTNVRMIEEGGHRLLQLYLLMPTVQRRYRLLLFKKIFFFGKRRRSYKEEIRKLRHIISMYRQEVQNLGGIL